MSPAEIQRRIKEIGRQIDQLSNGFLSLSPADKQQRVLKKVLLQGEKDELLALVEGKGA